MTSPTAPPSLLAAFGLTSEPLFGATLAAAAAFAVLLVGWRRWCQYGINRPVGLAWLALLPIGAVTGGVVGGSCLSRVEFNTAGELLVALLVTPLATEVLLRSAVHGYLVGFYRVQLPWGAWRPSIPIAAAAGLTPVVWLVLRAATLGDSPAWATGAGAVGALLLGVVAGFARERSRSLLGALSVHIAAAVWTLFFPTIVP
jgi:hypothetical protein